MEDLGDPLVVATAPSRLKRGRATACEAFPDEVPIGSQRGPVHVRLQGDMAWASSTSATQGEMNGRTINSEGAELMVLVRTAQGWKISAIHWSSRQRRPG